MKLSSINSGLVWLRKWLRGDVTWKQEHELESIAADDPFLADALEGFRAFPESNHQANIEALQQNIKAKYEQNEKGSSRFYLYRMAAVIAFVVLGIGGLWVINQNTDITNSAISQTESPKQIPSPVEEMRQEDSIPQSADQATNLGETESSNEETPILAQNQTQPQEEKKTTNIPINTKQQKREKDTQVTFNSPTTTPADLPKISPPVNDRSTETETVTTSPQKEYSINTESPNAFPTPPVPSPETTQPQPKVAEGADVKDLIARNEKEPGYATKKKAVGETRPTDLEEIADKMEEEVIEAEPDIPNISRAIAEAPASTLQKDEAKKQDNYLEERVISGIITNEEGEPLIGANVFAINTPQGTITGLDGRFKLRVQQQVEQLQVEYVGYASNVVNVRNQDEVEVQLMEGIVTLDEVSVAGYGKNRTKNKTNYFAPKPEKGFKKFERYVRKSTRIPEAAKAAKIEGQVLMQFRVNSDGSLSDFKVIQSLGYGWDEEAVRLLEEGEKWILSGGQRFGIATYLFEFEL